MRGSVHAIVVSCVFQEWTICEKCGKLIIMLSLSVVCKNADCYEKGG